MKTSLWLTLLALTAVTYGAIIVPAPVAQYPTLSKEAEDDALDKAGKTLETVGRILQGKNVESTQEDQQDILEVLQALTSEEGPESDEAAEYFLPIIARGVVAFGVKKYLDKRRG